MYVLSAMLLALFGGQQPIDDFRYSDAASARAAWTAGDHTPPVEVVADGDRPVLQLAAPFASQPTLPRAVIDRRVPLDLSMPGGFLLEVAADQPQAVGNLTLYFRSGKGWYAASKPIVKTGWQTLRLPKAAFSTEETPAGWDKIDAIRVCVWRSPGHDARDTAIRFRRLAAVWGEVAVVLPARSAAGQADERRAAHDAARSMTALLESLGLVADAIEEDGLSAATLGQRRVAILPYNPALSNEAAEALSQFVNSGGKLVVCYTLHPRLGKALGFGNVKWVGQQRAGQFAEMRFDAAGIAGLPPSVRQASWNINAAEPVGPGARVIGRWYDDAGAPTNRRAVLLSDRGAFITHIVLSDDADGKKRLLAALLGNLAPALWKDMAQAELEQASRVGHCTTAAELAAYLKESARGDELAQRAEQALAQAQRQFAQRAYVAAAASARTAHDALAQAYLLATKSPPREGRATWDHSGTGAYPGDWERSAKLLADNGFNMILPNMLWGGVAHYQSDVLPRSDTFRRYGDQIEQCCAAAKKHGIEVHVWKVNFNLGRSPKEFVERMRREGRTQVTVQGKPFDWLCPSHPENRQLELDSMVEVARKYPVDGLHFDYIRYPGTECCYCQGCRGRFEAQSGRKVADWPRECYSGARKEEYNDWRCSQITALVAAVSREARKVRPGLKISAAVFPSYPGCRRDVAQDWLGWIKAGYLDFICPMDYTNTGEDAECTAPLRRQVELIGGRIPLYAGIGATTPHPALTADRVVGQIHLARSLGAAGFVIFDFNPTTAAKVMPGVGLGAGSQPAVPPHRRGE